MCLSSVDKRTRKGTGVGYKAFAPDDSYHLSFPYYGGRVKYDSWYKSKDKGREYIWGTRDSYPLGFHIFLSLKDAKEWGGGSSVRRVGYRDVLASGEQSYKFPVVVARELYIYKGRV